MAQLLAGCHNAHGVAADGCKCGVNRLTKACVQLHSAVLIDHGSSSLCGLGTGSQNSGGLLELEDCRAGQVVGGQQTHDVSGLFSSLCGIGSHDGSHACLGGSCGAACIGDLIALGSGSKRSGEEQLCALGHDADVCVGSAQSAGAAADTQNNGHLRNNAGDLCDLCIQLCAGGQHVQTLGQLCANRVIEGDHRAAGLCSHFQNLDVLFNILYGDSLAILINGVSLLTCSIAAGSAHCTISKQRSVLPVIEELGEDFSLIDL